MEKFLVFKMPPTVRYSPADITRGLILSDHIHDRACIGFVVEGQCEERLSTRVLDLSQHKLFFRPAGEIHANRAGSNGFRCLIAEVPDAWLDHIRDYAALPTQPCCFQNADLILAFYEALPRMQTGRISESPANFLIRKKR
jgi:hypothetical protein